MRIDAGFLSAPALQAVLQMLEQGGHRALVVGGALRNAVLGQPVGDVDISTDARPERVRELAADAGLKSIPTGIEHGTITVISQSVPFEITTFRRDIETDGRNAVVAFSDRIEDDAARRDFTMNALYATSSGEVLDPVNGWPDLKRRHLRFVGDPTARIREDYLRILRFFRFLAWYAQDTAPGTVEAIGAEKDGLCRVSAERIGAELRKLLSAPDPGPATALMAATGVLDRILPSAATGALPALVLAEADRNADPDWRRRLALIAPGIPAERLRLSRAEARHLETITRAGNMPLAEAAFRHGAEIARDAGLIRLARGETLADDWPLMIDRAARAALPVSAADLMPGLSGAALGQGLKAAERLWIASDFSAERDALIAAALNGQEQS